MVFCGVIYLERLYVVCLRILTYKGRPILNAKKSDLAHSEREFAVCPKCKKSEVSAKYRFEAGKLDVLRFRVVRIGFFANPEWAKTRVSNGPPLFGHPDFCFQQNEFGISNP